MELKSLIAISALLMTVATTALATDVKRCVGTRLNGFNEVPAIHSAGAGTFKGTFDKNITALTYTLTFSGLATPVLFSHIHFGQEGVNGGVMAFLCGGGGKPPCPATGGTVEGVIMATDILGLPLQGINAGSFSDFADVLLSNNGYVNVHTTAHAPGEIRGQLRKLVHC